MRRERVSPTENGLIGAGYEALRRVAFFHYQYCSKC